tara:strand:+ start:183166 stop:183375 length:210 start_codon:yes stop_codon:yes gene_type:complete
MDDGILATLFVIFCAHKTDLHWVWNVLRVWFNFGLTEEALICSGIACVQEEKVPAATRADENATSYGHI